MSMGGKANLGAFGTLTRFHLGAGVRATQRAMAPVVGLAVGAIAILGESVGALLMVLVESRFGLLLAAFLGLVFVRFAATRTLLHRQAWIGHLPLSARQMRWSMVWALALGAWPAWAVAMLMVVLEPEPGWGRTVSSLAGCLLALVGVTQAAVPGERLLARGLAAGAVALAVTPYPVARLIAVAFLILSCWSTSGPGTGRRARPVPGEQGALLLDWRVTFRALGTVTVLQSLGGAVLALLPGVFLLANNQLSREVSQGVVRGTVGAAMALAIASLKEAMVARRPRWSWQRSLPRSCVSRVALDTGFLGVHLVPLGAVALVASPRTVPALLVLASTLASLGAGGIARAYRPTGSGGLDAGLIAGAVAVLLIALVPWLALACLALLPSIFRRAVTAEREARALFDERRQGALDDAEMAGPR